jgi:hypothetical protein
MKVNRQELSSALALVCKLADRPTKHKGKISISDSGYVRLHTHVNGLWVSGSLKNDDFVMIDVDVMTCGREMFDVLVPAHELMDFVKSETKAKKHELIRLELAIAGFEVVTENGNLRQFAMVSGTGWFQSPITLGLTKSASYNARELRSALDFVIPCISKDETRPHICRLAFLGRRIAATDGCRLHVAETSTNGPAEASISPKAAKCLQAACLSVTDFDVYLSQNVSKAGCIHFVSPRISIVANLIGSDFPLIDQVIPASVSHYVMRTKELVKALKSAAHDNVKFTCNGDITLDVTVDNVSSRSVVNTLRSPSSESVVVVGFDRRLVLAALDTKDETVNVQITGQWDPMRVDHGRGCVAVIMPMRI